MTPVRGLIQSLKGWLGKPVASPDSDPQRWFGNLIALPNPDPILREMGQAERVYYSISADPHVLGDIRSIRGNFRSHDFRLLAGDEGDSKSLAALELCQDWIKRVRPNPLSDWLEVQWQMASAALTGYRPHEVVWELMDGKYLPSQVWDRPNRRMKFNAWGEPMLITRTNMLGAPVEPYQFVISRHMATLENPYGVAVLSSCFWPWTFKTGGWRSFVKYCERHGLPWPVGRYPLGTSEPDQKSLAAALESMLESSYLVAPEGTGIELLTPSKSSGDLPQHALIDMCNAEMSKAMTGQAMVAELRGVGARAASETAMKRQESIDDSVRDISAQSMGEILRWITLFNFGDGVAPPTVDYFRQGTGNKERVDVYQAALNMGANPSRSALLEEMGIPEAKDEADQLQRSQGDTAQAGTMNGRQTAPPTNEVDTAPAGGSGQVPTTINMMSGVAGFEFAKAAGMTEDEAIQLATDAADSAIEDHMIAPVVSMLERFEAEGKTLAEFKDAFTDLVGAMDDEALREVLERAMSYSILRGAATRVG